LNNRRKLVIALGAGALAVPFRVWAQQGKIPRIGFLSSFPSANDPRFEVFKQQLRELGHVEGKTIAIDYQSAEGKYDRLPVLAAELVRHNVDVIMTAGGTPTVVAAKNATRTIPVVFAGVSDPVGQGIVASLARPGGNVTGATIQSGDTVGKIVALFKEIAPSAKLVTVLSNPLNSSLPPEIKAMQAVAKTLRVDMAVVNAAAPAEFEKAFAEIARDRPAGLIIPTDAMFVSEAARLTTLATRHRLPTVSGHSAFPESGGLMSYGANLRDVVRRGAFLVDKILKGAKPADLPVEQPTKFELVLNMKTAKALGIKIPNSILVQATKVIE
jgi:putative ABC transport system substrate-binding protein